MLTMTSASIGVALLAGALVAAPPLGARLQTEPAFDVVSIKPAVPPPTSPGGVPLVVSGSFFVRNGRFRAPYATVNALIRVAFDVKDAQIVGGPDWLTTAQYEILATADPATTDATLRQRLPALLRALLTERFSLDAHRERRAFPVYALIKARKDARLGPQLRPTAANCRDVFCGDGSGRLVKRDIAMTSLADVLTRYADRPVVDHTELPGKFDVDLQWAAGRRLGSGVNAPVDPIPDSDGPSLFSAIQEQLGLKLEPRQEPMDLLVIDRVGRPTPN